MTFFGMARFVGEVIFGVRGPMPRVGDIAPDFVATDHLGRAVSLRDLRGRNVVLWFFPKSDTPG